MSGRHLGRLAHPAPTLRQAVMFCAALTATAAAIAAGLMTGVGAW